MEKGIEGTNDILLKSEEGVGEKGREVGKVYRVSAHPMQGAGKGIGRGAGEGGERRTPLVPLR